MGSPYTEQSESGYNASPPSDDGSQVASNQVLWATIKTKLGDPIKALAEDIDDAVSAAFAKMIGGGAVATLTNDYTVLSSDQGKLLALDAADTTFTTPDATDVGSPFVFAVVNLNDSGNLTIDGSGAQTVNGAPTISLGPRDGGLLFTDGSNWFYTGPQSIVGTFVPGLTFGGLSTGLTYTSQSGNYTRTGNVVHVEISMTVNSNGSATGDALVTGLPFPALGVAVLAVSYDGFALTTDSVYAFGLTAAGESGVLLCAAIDGDTETYDETFIIDGATIGVTGSYICE